MGKESIKIEELTAEYEKKIYDLEQLLDISKSFSSTLESSKLLESIIFSCMAQLRVVDAGVFVLDLLNSDFFTLETNNTPLKDPNCKKIQIPFTDPVISFLSTQSTPITLDTIKATCTETTGVKILTELNPTLIVPLIQKNHINGILFLGEQFSLDSESESGFTEYEKNLVQTIASLATIAINNAALIERSSTDMMTQLKLKYYFYNILTEKLHNAMDQDIPLSVIMFDIDFFKHFNDTYGHECGDYVLKQVAAIIKANLREDDLASRYGGEEFTVMLNDTKKDDAMNIAERIRSCIESHDFSFNDQHMKVTISCGVAVFDKKTNPITVAKQIVSQADQGLYMSKHNGRNRVTYAPPSLVSETEAQ